VPNPCIIDTDCIALSLDGSGNLQADITLDPDPENALTCGDDGLFGDICPISEVACNGLIKEVDNGLWTHKISRDTAVSTFPAATYLGLTPGDGNVIVQSGTQSIKNNGCADALIFRNIAYGTSQITDLDTGGTRCELETQGNTDGGPFTDHGFAVLQNNTGDPLEHAWWPTHAPEIGFAVLAAGATQTVGFRRRAQMFGGTGDVNYRACFIFTQVLSISGL
jgi:hypothetical protein